MGFTLLALNIWNYRAMKNRWNTEPYADGFFDSDDESAHVSQSSLNVRWMDAEIEILEEDDDSDSGAWEPLDSKDKNVHPNEPTTSNGHTTKNNPAPNNNFVSSDDESKGVTAKETQQDTQKAKALLQMQRLPWRSREWSASKGLGRELQLVPKRAGWPASSKAKCGQ